MLPKLGAKDFAKALDQLLWIRNRASNIGWGFCDAVDDLTSTILTSNDTSPAKLRRCAAGDMSNRSVRGG